MRSTDIPKASWLLFDRDKHCTIFLLVDPEETTRELERREFVYRVEDSIYFERAFHQATILAM